MEAGEATRNALDCVLGAKKGESIVIFCDDEKASIGQAFVEGALKLGLQTRLVQLGTEPNVFRTELSKQLTDIIAKQPPNIYINLLRGVREETVFRIKLTRMETREHKARLGHCPGVTLDMLTKGALALTAKEHKQMQNFAKHLIKKLGKATKMEITNPSGTSLSLSIEGRPFFTDTIVNWETLKWMNLPTGEVIVAPEENSLEGTLVCDMAVGGIGPIKDPLRLTVLHGKVKDSSSTDQQVLRRIKDSLGTDERSDVVGEFAFGINPKARFVEEFLEAEKMLETIHIAFGNNSDMPEGKNKSANHMDLLISKPTVNVINKDGSSMKALENGNFQFL